MGGVTVGYDFVNAGFGGYAYPDWMKYFSFAVDFTYNRLTIQDAWPGHRAIFAWQLQNQWHGVGLDFPVHGPLWFLS